MKFFMSYRLTLAIVLGVASFGSTYAQENMTLCMSGVKNQQAGQHDQAIADLENCIKTGNLSQSNLARTYRILGMNYNDKKDHRKAIEHYNQALTLNPPDPWNDYVNRGNAQSGLGDFQQALSDYETAIKANPNFGGAYFNRGIVYEKMRDIDKAKADILLGFQKGYRSQQISERMAYYQLPVGEGNKFDYTKPITSTELLSGFLFQLVSSSNGKQLCFEQNLTLADVRPAVQAELQRMGIQNNPTGHQAATALYSLYPCPFSSREKSLRSATSKDLMGVWLYPDSSQKYRFPSQSQAWAQNRTLPIKCDGVGFYPEGEMRTARILGMQSICPFASEKDMDPVRKNPRVASWNMLREGRLNVTRTDVAEHIEEWDMLIATADFEAKGLQVKRGDLMGYLRRERGNDWNIATTFWHLQKLP